MNEKYLQNSVNVNPLVEAGVDLLDTALSTAEVLPFLKPFFAIAKTAGNISDYLLREKIRAFLNGMKSYAETTKDFSNLLEDEKVQHKLGVNILVIIDQTDSIDKTTLIGKLYGDCISRKTDIGEYYRLCKILEKVIFEDLAYLQKFEQCETIICSENDCIPEYVLDTLFSSGLLFNKGFDGGDMSGGPEGTRYAINTFGEKVRNVMREH